MVKHIHYTNLIAMVINRYPLQRRTSEENSSS